MIKPKISIIIPVFDVSLYLRECLDSVVNQKFRDIEVIVVNDCSPDLQDDVICEEYAAKDERIIYIKHKNNLGLGGARNTGVNVAKADYVGFVDSDDYILPSMYEKMYESMVLSQCDVVAINYTRMSNNTLINKNEITTSGLHEVSSGLELLSGFSQNNIKLNMMMPLKLWKRSLFTDNNILLPENIHYEDACTTPKLFYFAKRIYLIKDCLYVYRSRDGSITSSIPRIEDFMAVIDSVRLFLIEKDCYKNLRKIFLYEYVYGQIVYCLQQSEISHEVENERYLYALNIVKHLNSLKLIEEFFEEFDSEEIRQILFFKQNKASNMIVQDPWYIFGQLPIKRKFRFIVAAILRKTGLLPAIEP